MAEIFAFSFFAFPVNPLVFRQFFLCFVLAHFLLLYKDKIMNAERRDDMVLQVFSYQFDLWRELEFLLRIFIACILGYMIGFERKSRDKCAGMRTHAIVAMGSALFMIISKYSFPDVLDYDASRIAAQIVSGVGFLGAGVIFIRNNAISGLTTAAGLWTTSGVGMAVGAGSYVLGICSGLMVTLIQVALHRIRFLSKEPIRGYLKLTTLEYDSVLQDIQKEFSQNKIRILGIKINKGKTEIKIELELIYPPHFEKNDMILAWSQDPRIVGITG